MSTDHVVAAADLPGLCLLVLHGSRGRGDAGPRSDWDFAYLADGQLDPTELLARLTVAVGTDAVDLADLSTTSALLRFRAARDGVALLERPPARSCSSGSKRCGSGATPAPSSAPPRPTSSRRSDESGHRP